MWNLKRFTKLLLITFILVGLTITSFGCASESGPESLSQNQIVNVERGDLTVVITAVGNLALSRSEDLAFDLFYQEGTVEEVLVEEGDIVNEGQVLASLDTEEWEDELKELQDELTQAERQLTVKERALVQAKRGVITLEREVTDVKGDIIKAERQVTAVELAVSQAQLNLETAEYNLSEIDEVKEAQDTIDEAELSLELARMGLTAEFGGGSQSDFIYWNHLKTLAEAELVEAKTDLQDILEDNGITLSKDVALEVADKQLKVKQKQLALEDAQLDVADAEKAVDDAMYALESAELDVVEARHDVEDGKLDIEEAKEALADAQKEMEKANSKSPLIVAPFDGFITKVNVEGGDEVLSGTIAVQLADPSKFEAEIMVSEMDISQVKEGGEAWMQVDALSGLSLPAEVIHISPTATIQSGVVNYQVKVVIESHEGVMQKRQQAQGEQQRQIPAEMSKDFQLREGLTVTVHILVAERNNVLLVPNQAITRLGMETLVQVSKEGVTEERVIQVGISDWQFTEITDGLSEGEQIIVRQRTTTTSTNSTPRRPVPFMRPPHD
jgi:HlyD family secretion protein